MIRLQKCYSNQKARRMKENKARVAKLKASLRDWIYLSFIAYILISIFGQFNVKISSKSVVEAKEPVQTIVREKLVKEPDTRIIRLQEYLQEKHSPLSDYSELIITEADKYGVDWTKIVAIACLESACGLKLPAGSHNAWGLGGSRFMYFKDWKEGIQYVSKLLGTKYKQAENQGIKYSYCPESDNCNPSWAFIVTKTSNEILSLEGKK